MHRAVAIEKQLFTSHSSPQHTSNQNSVDSTPRLTVFCDFDGPIIDVSERYYQTYLLALTAVQEAYQQIDCALPLHRLTKDQFWQMKQNRVPDVEIAMRSGLQAAQIDGFIEQVTRIVNQPALLHQDELQPGVRWALALLHAQGARLVLVTLRCQQQATEILQNYGLLHLFDGIHGTHEEQAAYHNFSEQKTQLLAQAMRSLHLENTPHVEAWMVGDTEADILAGQAMGIPTVALTCGIRSKRYLNSFAPSRIHTDLLSASHFLVYQQEITPAIVA